MSFAVVRRFGFSLSVMLFLSSGLMAQRSYDGNSNAPQAPATVNITQGPTIQYADDQFAVITWTTDQPFVSRVFYGKDASNLNQIAEDVRSQSLRHQINLRNLQASTVVWLNGTYGYVPRGYRQRLSVRPRFETSASARSPCASVTVRILRPLSTSRM